MSQEPVFIVVENNEEYQDILKMAFKKSQTNGQLLFSSDSKQLFEWLEKLEVNPNLIILDYELTASNGLELAKRIFLSNEWNTIPVIMFSFLENETVKESALKLGIKAFIQKPDSYSGTIAFWNEINTYSFNR